MEEDTMLFSVFDRYGNIRDAMEFTIDYSQKHWLENTLRKFARMAYQNFLPVEIDPKTYDGWRKPSTHFVVEIRKYKIVDGVREKIDS